MASDDFALLQRWKENSDAEAFRALVARHGAMVHAACRRVLGGATGADDAAQECFEALAAAGEVPGHYLGAWLHRVATFHALNLRRREVRLKQREDTYAQARPTAVEATWEEVYEHVDVALNALPESLRAPLVAYYLEQQPQAEIAAELGLSREQVNRRIAKGIAQMRARLHKKSLYVGIGALGAMLESRAAEHLPAAVAARLTKIALAGPHAAGPLAARAAMQQAAANSSRLAMPVMWSIAAVLIVFCSVFFLLWRSSATIPLQSNGSTAATMDAEVQASTPPVSSPTPSSGEPETPVAQPTSPASPANSGNTASVAGVLHDPNGAALGNYRVEAYLLGVERGKSGTSSALTGPQGEFTLDKLAPGRHFLFCTGRKLPPLTSEDKERRFSLFSTVTQDTVVELVPDEKKTGVVLVLDEGLTISGRVVDANGKPIAGVSVHGDPPLEYLHDHPLPLADEAPHDPAALFAFTIHGFHAEDSTDAQGRFKLATLYDADYKLSFQKKGFKVGSESARAGTGNLEETLTPLEPLTISGRVIDIDTKAPVTDFEVGYSSVYNGLWGSLKYMTVSQHFHNTEGRFTLKVEKASLGGFAVARADGYFQNCINIIGLRSEYEDKIQDVTLEIFKGRKVSGTVLGPADRPVAEALVYIGAAPGPSFSMVAEDALATCDSDGRFSCTIPASRPISLSAISQQNTAWHRYLVGGAVQLPADSNDADHVLIKLQRDGATFHGRLSFLGKPLATSILLQAEEAMYKTWGATSDDNGDYALNDLPPLTQATLAMHSSTSPGFGPYAPGGVAYRHISLERRISFPVPSDQAINLDFTGGNATIRGTILIGGIPLESQAVNITIERADEVIQSYIADTDENGDFVAAGLPPGQGRVSKQGLHLDQRFLRWEMPFELHAGATLDLVCDFTQENTVPLDELARPF